jgi:diguanylate cyclase (GGDEF)-like protein
MEIKVYLKLLQKRWWLVLLVLIIALAATAYFTLNMKPLYRAEATYIVRVSASEEERNVISAINTLTSRSEIAATYAGVANSSSIKNKAADDLGISHNNSLEVSSQVQSGTNIVEISVEGNDPALVRDYTNAIGAQTVEYVESLYETYRLELLDEAVLPGSPARPSMVQNLTLGGILGLLLGMGLVIFMEYLKVPSGSDAMFNILDERIGIYDMRYFRERLHQEMSRSRRHKHMLSVALVNIDHRHLLENVSPEVRLSAMRSVVTAVGRSLRDEDVMAASSDTELAVLMPELDGERAKIAVERILAIVSKISVELNPTGKTISLNGAAGVAPFHNGERATTDVLIARARTALDSMRESTYGRVMVSAEGAVNEVSSQRSEPLEERKEAQLITEETEVVEQGEMSASAPLVHEAPEAEDVLAAEAGEVVDDSNGRHRKKARGRKQDNGETYSNKLEVSET